MDEHPVAEGEGLRVLTIGVATLRRRPEVILLQAVEVSPGRAGGEVGRDSAGHERCRVVVRDRVTELDEEANGARGGAGKGLHDWCDDGRQVGLVERLTLG